MSVISSQTTRDISNETKYSSLRKTIYRNNQKQKRQKASIKPKCKMNSIIIDSLYSLENFKFKKKKFK